MNPDETNIFLSEARDTIDELRRESELKPIQGIKKRLIFITNLLQEVGLPKIKGYYVLACPGDNGFIHGNQAKIDPQNSQVSCSPDLSRVKNLRPIPWIRLLTKKRKYILGRGPSLTDLTFDDPFVSQKHCHLIYDPKGWKLVDLNSRNGVRVNFIETEKKYLRSGDLINLSSQTSLIFINTHLFKSDSNNSIRKEEAAISLAGTP